MIPYAFLTLSMIFYGIYTLSLTTFYEPKLIQNMNKKSHNYEIINWVNSKVSANDLVLYYSTVRTNHIKIIIFYFIIKLNYQ